MTQTVLPNIAGLYVQNMQGQTIKGQNLDALGMDGHSHDPQQPLAFPLKHTEVKARVSGNLSRVEVTQTFENPFTTALEAIYVFPLPDEAAVDAMEIRFADQTIRGRIEKREQAQALYDTAKQQGQTAGLLEQERANLFTQSLVNILPGEQIEVVIGYSDRLVYQQGAYEFIFPMVVGPRYIPGNLIEGVGTHGSATEPMMLNQDTDVVPDASRLNNPTLPAGMRSGHDIQVTIEIETGNAQGKFALSNIQSPSHQIVMDTQETLTTLSLAPSDTLPNKDLMVRYQVSGDATQASLLTQSDQRGGHFALYLIPALSYDKTEYIPKDMVFLIDTSGSQSGAPLAQCQALMRRFLQGLHPQDCFNIVNFANTTQQLSSVPLENTPHNRKQALKYVDRLRAGGGTEMIRGLKTVLNLPELSRERLRNIVLLTDGYIGNETQIFAEVQRSLSLSSRLHSFGAGSSVNRFLLNRVAEFGRGIAHVVRHDQPIDTVVDQFFGQINNPVLGNISLHWDGPGETPNLYPMAPPDLFAEQPLTLLGRKADNQPGTLWVRGLMANGRQFEQSFTVSFESLGNPAIAQLWGRARIKDLMNQMVAGETTRGVQSVTSTALAYQLLSRYTAFIAVGEEVRVEQPEASVSVKVPVNMPEAVSYEGVFGIAVNARPAASLPSQLFLRPRRATLPRGAAPKKAASLPDNVDILRSPAEAPASEMTRMAKPAGAPPPQPSSPQQIQILKVEGLRDNVLKHLQQHLQVLQLASARPGKLIFELIIQRGRVKRVMLDLEASEAQNPEVVALIRKALVGWQCPQKTLFPLQAKVQLQL